jgi:hypothetical protein
MHLFQLLDIERLYNDTTDKKLHASSYLVVKMYAILAVTISKYYVSSHKELSSKAGRS